LVRIHLVRHAAFPGVGHVLAGRLPGIALNELGRSQAAAIGERIAETPQLVWCSPQQRARETAAILAAPLGLEPRVHDAFDELDFGEWTGREIDSLRGDPRWRDFNRFRALVPPPGGEPFPVMQARAMAGLLQLAGAAGQGTEATAAPPAPPAPPAATGTPAVHVVVTHADVIRAILATVLQMPASAAVHLQIGPASVSTLELHGAWVEVAGVNR
jgi:broad specificity phosphatase PhoE